MLRGSGLFTAWKDLRSTVNNCAPVDFGGDLWVEQGVLGILPNKLCTTLTFHVFSRAVYKSGMGLVCISKLTSGNILPFFGHLLSTYCISSII